jgi:sugar-specific transcriptional regulator TrmB
MSTKFVEDLTEVGLTEKESRVYNVLIKNGIGTAEQIANEAHLNRSTTYVQLDRLMEIGLVSRFKDGKKTKFAAESPLNLRQYIKAQEADIQRREAKVGSLIPDLLKIYASSGEQAQVRYFEGVEGLRQVRNEVLNVKAKKYYAAASLDHINNLFSEKELWEFSVKRARRNIESKLIYTSNHITPKISGKQEFIKVDETRFPFNADIYIYDDKVSFANTSERVGGIIIQSSPIAKTMSSLFELVWLANKPNTLN